MHLDKPEPNRPRLVSTLHNKGRFQPTQDNT